MEARRPIFVTAERAVLAGAEVSGLGLVLLMNPNDDEGSAAGGFALLITLPRSKSDGMRAPITMLIPEWLCDQERHRAESLRHHGDGSAG